MTDPTPEDLGDAVAEVLADFAGIVAAYAFGSRVSGRPHPLSDVDIALVTRADGATEDPLLAERVGARLTLQLDSAAELDVHIASRLPLPVRGRVVTEGVLLYEADASARVDFETSTLRLYLDFLPFLERDAREGLLAGG